MSTLSKLHKKHRGQQFRRSVTDAAKKHTRALAKPACAIPDAGRKLPNPPSLSKTRPGHGFRAMPSPPPHTYRPDDFDKHWSTCSAIRGLTRPQLSKRSPKTANSTGQHFGPLPERCRNFAAHGQCTLCQRLLWRTSCGFLFAPSAALPVSVLGTPQLSGFGRSRPPVAIMPLRSNHVKHIRCRSFVDSGFKRRFLVRPGKAKGGVGWGGGNDNQTPTVNSNGQLERPNREVNSGDQVGPSTWLHAKHRTSAYPLR